MTLPSSPPKEKVVVQNPPANQPKEKKQMTFAFGNVKESEQATEKKDKEPEQAAERAEPEQAEPEQAAERAEAEQAEPEQAEPEQAAERAEQNNEVQIEEVDVSPPPSVSVAEMMKSSTPTNSQSELRHTPSLSPIIEHVSCYM